MAMMISEAVSTYLISDIRNLFGKRWGDRLRGWSRPGKASAVLYGLYYLFPQSPASQILSIGTFFFNRGRSIPTGSRHPHSYFFVGKMFEMTELRHDRVVQLRICGMTDVCHPESFFSSQGMKVTHLTENFTLITTISVKVSPRSSCRVIDVQSSYVIDLTRYQRYRDTRYPRSISDILIWFRCSLCCLMCRIRHKRNEMIEKSLWKRKGKAFPLISPPPPTPPTHPSPRLTSNIWHIWSWNLDI